MKLSVLLTAACCTTALAGCSSPRADERMTHQSNALGAKTSLDEFGESPGYWHDMMTGSNPDGTLANGDVTCGNWAEGGRGETAPRGGIQ